MQIFNRITIEEKVESKHISYNPGNTEIWQKFNARKRNLFSSGNKKKSKYHEDCNTSLLLKTGTMVGVGVGGIDKTGGFGLREGTGVGITVG